MSDPLCPIHQQRGRLLDFRGREFYPFDPRPEDIRIEDIAFILSRLKRFGGESDLTVAEHCLIVSRLLQSWGHSIQTQLHGLLHDAHETWTGDIRRPFTKDIRFETDDCTFKELTERLDQAIYAALAPEVLASENITYHSEQVRIADEVALFWELRDIHPTPLPWAIPGDDRKRLIPDRVLGAWHEEKRIQTIFLFQYASLRPE